MPTITLSSRFQIGIPRDIRESLDLKPGQKMHVFRYAGRIEFIPLRPIRAMRRFLRRMDTSIS